MPKFVLSRRITVLALGGLLSIVPAYAGSVSYTEPASDVFALLPAQSQLKQTSEEISRRGAISESQDDLNRFGRIIFGLEGIVFLNPREAKTTPSQDINDLTRTLTGLGYDSMPIIQAVAVAENTAVAAMDADTPELATMIMIGTGLMLMRFLKKAWFQL